MPREENADVLWKLGVRNDDPVCVLAKEELSQSQGMLASVGINVSSEF